MTPEEIIAEIDDNSCEAEIEWAIGEVQAAQANLTRSNYTPEQQVNAGSYNLHGVTDSLKTALGEHAKLCAKLRDAADALEAAEKRANEVTELLLNANSKLHTQGDYIVSLESKLKELEKQLEGAREAWAIAETNGRILASTVRGTTDASWATYRAIFSEPQIDAERIGYRAVPVLIVPKEPK